MIHSLKSTLELRHPLHWPCPQTSQTFFWVNSTSFLGSNSGSRAVLIKLTQLSTGSREPPFPPQNTGTQEWMHQELGNYRTHDAPTLLSEIWVIELFANPILMENFGHKMFSMVHKNSKCPWTLSLPQASHCTFNCQLGLLYLHFLGHQKCQISKYQNSQNYKLISHIILYSVLILGSVLLLRGHKRLVHLSGRTLLRVNIQLPKVQPSLRLDWYLQGRPVPMGTCQPHHHKLFLKQASIGPSLNCNTRV